MNEGKPIDLTYVLGYVFGALTFIVAAKSILRVIDEEGNRAAPNVILQPAEAVELYMRQEMSDAEFYDMMLSNGYKKERADQLVKIAETLIPFADLVNGFFKGKIDKGDFLFRAGQLNITNEVAELRADIARPILDPGAVIEAELRGLSTLGGPTDFSKDISSAGWTDDRIAMLRKLGYKVPSLQDVFNFAAYQVDDDDFAAKFGLDEGMPADYYDNAKAAGIPADFAKRAWRAHWQLPQIFILRTLAQTGAYSTDDIKKFLSVQMFPPKFLESTANAMFKSLTMTDIIDLISLGKITETDLPNYVQYLGYPESQKDNLIALIKSKAQTAAQKAAKQKAADVSVVKGLSVSNVLQAYELGIIDNHQTQTYLSELGETPEAIGIHVSLANFKMQSDAVKSSVSDIKDNFLSGAIDQNEAVSELTKLGISSSKQYEYIASWTRSLKKTSKIPSEAQLHTFAKKGIITIDEYIYYLTLLGYSQDWANAFAQDLATAPSTATAGA